MYLPFRCPMHCIEGGTLLLPRNLLFVIELVIVIAGILMAGNSTYASHSGAECYLNGHRIYVPDGLNYPRQAWAGWGISCRTATPEIAAGSAAIGADSAEGARGWLVDAATPGGTLRS